MKAEFTAIIEAAPEGGYWAICPEIPGANGQGETVEETENHSREAVELVLEDRRADILRGLPEDAIQDKVVIGWDELKKCRIGKPTQRLNRWGYPPRALRSVYANLERVSKLDIKPVELVKTNESLPVPKKP